MANVQNESTGFISPYFVTYYMDYKNETKCIGSTRPK